MDNSFRVTTDLRHGGRWTSLRDPAGREWLWRGLASGRDGVRPGDPFVDAGGLEECFPTIGGNPDHGDVWSRPWTPTGPGEPATRCRVNTADGTLSRTISVGNQEVVIDYVLESDPGFGFIWAGHALLELAVGSHIAAEPGPVNAFPGHAAPRATSWPTPLDIDFGSLPKDDGSAMFCVLLDCPQVVVSDSNDTLRFRLECEGQPFGFGVWRNLGGFPWDGSPTYRNIGIEPMLGYEFDRSRADPSNLARVPASGIVRWRVRIDNG